MVLRRLLAALTARRPPGEEVLSARVVGGISSVLFVLCGALVALAGLLIPYPAGVSRPGLELVGAAAVGCGAVIWFMPWNRWGPASTLALVPVALTLVVLHNVFTGYDGFVYGLFFMVIFVWVGLGHPRGTSAAISPLLTAAYLVPLVVQGRPSGVALASATYTLPCCVLVGETVAWVSARLRRSEGALRSSEERFRSLVQESADVVVLTSAQGITTYASPSLTRVLGHRVEDWIGHAPNVYVHPSDRARLDQTWERLVEEPGSIAREQARLADAQGGYRWCAVVMRNLLHEPAVRAVVANFTDVTGRVALEEQLRHQAYHDPLTGLANRALFTDRLEEALRRSDRDRTGLAVLLLDIDAFKTVNDSLGHSSGDELLMAVSERLGSRLRPGDTAARLGGDEFVVLAEVLAHPEEAMVLAERLRKTLTAPFALGGRQVAIRASIGIAMVWPGDQVTGEELLRNADVAMYVAKSAGQGGHAEFKPHMHEAALARLEMESELRSALSDGQLELHYQPIVGLPGRQVVGAEALIRWHHPAKGMVMPGQFIPVAEQSGLIDDIGTWVLNAACRQVAVWSATGGPAEVAVNVSARQLSSSEFVGVVRGSLAASGATPARLTLEITESVLMDDPDAASRTLADLRRLGVRVAIDDFGTGYSSLSYLGRFPLDYLKVDRSFVAGLGTDDASECVGHAPLVSGIAQLGAALGLTVVAEGVETEYQAAAVARLGCHLAQGYLFGRPVPAGVLRASLDRMPAESVAVAT